MKLFKDDDTRKKFYLGASLIILFFLIYNISYIWKFITKITGIMLPFIVGLAIAFVLNVPMRWIESGLFKNREKYSGKGWDGFRRALALIITLFLAFLIITFLIYMVVPQLADTITQLVKQIPAGVNNITKWADGVFSREPILLQVIQAVIDNWEKVLEGITGFIKSYLNTLVEGGINTITGIVSGIFNFILGFIFAMYVLVQKEKLSENLKKVTYGLFEKKTADEMVEVTKLAGTTFANFISGQCTEAIILCGMFSLTLILFRIPYALLISILIGATSLIPIVGTFIGCAIGVLLILIEDPMKAILFLVLFLILQQIEGNFIYPKVVGDSVGLPGIWVLVSVTVGGSLFGVVGMITFIPMVSIMYALFRRYIYGRLEKKELLDMFPKEEEVPKKKKRKRKKKSEEDEETESVEDDDSAEIREEVHKRR